jgi:hypothetical protein
MNRLLFIQRTTPSVFRFSNGFVVALVAATFAAALGCAMSAAKADDSELKLTTEKVIVFKDGYCLIIKRGTAVADKNGEVYTAEVPDSAVLGSFWATPKEGRLVNITAGWKETEQETKKEVACSGTLEILEANLGKQCSLQLPDKSFLEGKIAQVLTQPTSTAITEPERVALGFPVTALRPQLSSAAVPTVHSQVITGIVGSQFVMKTEDGDVLIPASDVQRLTIKDMKTTLTRTIKTKERTKRLTFRFAEAGQRQDMLLMYFRPGVRWIPTYRVNLTANAKKEKVAEISMQAEILNEAEDLIDMPVDIVVGVPNFRFRTNVSPLVLEQTLRNALVEAAPNLMGNYRNDLSNALMTQRIGEFRRDAAHANAVADGGSVDLPDELTASGAQDLFVYNLPKMTLRKGERAAVPILSTEVPYRDIYTWDLHLKRSDIATAPSGSGVESPLALSQNKVWRQIELVNNTNLPWTTGAAMIMEGRQPLAQELLTYTSPKDYCRVPVTVSVDTRGSFEESETGRELKALRWSGYDYAKVHLKASLDVCNNKPETIDVEIAIRFGGKADEVSHDGKVTLAAYRAEDWQDYRGHPAVNNSSVVVWRATLKPGETFQPTVDFHYFTRQ